ncbi:MAG: N-6 DNA methylase [Opitutaceae bacterium]|nr:N-6 DNA methylase [Opitutaceae bacterium]
MPLPLAALREALRQPYQRATWTGGKDNAGLLRQFFAQTQVDFRLTPHSVEFPGKIARRILQLGVVTLADSKRLGVFEVELADTSTHIARNRVGLRELARRLIDEATIHGALAFYFHPQVGEYRFSFISRQSRIESDGSLSASETHPKRFTYVLGPGELCRTPAERFGLLAAQATPVTITDLVEAFSVEKLTREFYQQLQHWYFWALGHVRFPADAPKDDGRDSLSLIRLLTRLIFVWFLKEKGLVPPNLFDPAALARLLRHFSPDDETVRASAYYRAILQNLFFATLNSESEHRGWAREGQNMMAHSLYRFREEFVSPTSALDLFRDIPFLNGGLFECLDKDLGEGAKPRYVRIDGFSRREDSQPVVPDFLFFGPEQDADLSAFYEEKKPGRKSRPARVRGLLAILHDFKFTIEENTPLDEDVALDPELLGRVFENLLAAYNPETQVTARKQTGSFYTPREIVDYMTGQALFYALREKVPGLPDLDTRLPSALAHDDAPNPFNSAETGQLIAALDDLKVLDPACGSGAFPMGVLHRLVHLLQKIDPGNARWKKRQLDKAAEIPDATVRERVLADIEQAFGANELGYGRKLYLIENCLYGVDIQPIAAQITKLRFFISLVVEQRTDPAAPNRGIRPLPNLETKIVAANTLLGVERKEKQADFLTEDTAAHIELHKLRHALTKVRDDHFLARTSKTKAKCREDDKRIRAEMSALLEKAGMTAALSRQLSAWDPYDQNAHASFFDSEWMFGLTEGFDVIVGNPPYRMLQPHNTAQSDLDYFREHFVSAEFKIELFHLFLQRGTLLLQDCGCLAFIVPSSILNNVYAEKLRRWLMEHCAIRSIAVSPDRVFAAADVHTSVIILGRETNPGRRKENVVATTTALTPQFARTPGAYDRTLQARFAALPGAIWNILLNEDNAGLFEKLRATSSSLESVSKINRGLISGDRDQYFSEKKLTGKHIPILTGADVDRYALKPSTEFVLFERPDSAGGCWDEDVHLAPHKIVVRQIGTKPTASFLAKPVAVTGNIFTIRGENEDHELFILGILNSKLIEYFWRIMFSDFKSSFPQVTIFSLSQVPVVVTRAGDAKQHSLRKRLVTLVDQILAAKQADAGADTSAPEAEIDRHVYALYGLTPAEIKIVEESASAAK